MFWRRASGNFCGKHRLFDFIFDCFHFLREIVYLGVHRYLDREETDRFLASVVNAAHNLEVMLFGSADGYTHTMYINELCLVLSSLVMVKDRFSNSKKRKYSKLERSS